MNTEMTPETMSPQPKLADFPSLAPALLAAFGADYMPNMGMEELRCTQQYYLKSRRAPKCADELAFLDAFVLKNHLDPNSHLISEMTTEDAFLAESFADLMAKRAVVLKKYQIPCAIPEIPQIAHRYLKQAKKQSPILGALRFACGSHAPLALTAARTTPKLLEGNAESGFAVGQKIPRALLCHAPLSAGDKLYIFSKNTDPREDFEEKLLALTASSAVATRAKKICLIDERGALAALTEPNMGFELSLSKLYGEEASAVRLLAPDAGVLVIMREADAAEMLMLSLDMGLRPRFVGELRQDDQILLKTDGESFAFSCTFLRALTFSHAYHIEMKREDKTPRLTITSRTETAEELSFCFAAVRSDGAQNAALYGTLCAVSAAVAAGAEPSELRIAYELSLSLTPEHMGSDLALTLGLYRAMTELDLHSLASNVRRGKASCSIYTVAEPPENTIPDRLVHTDSHIYLLEPLYDENGNPDFEDYRKMLGYVENLQAKNVIFSARAVYGDVMPALVEMSRNSLVEYLGSEPYAAKAGAILVEARVEIEGILLGKTCPPPAAGENDTDAPEDTQNEDNNA